MSCISGYCCCCYSAETLKILNIPELDVYKSICGFQALKDDDTSLIICLRCHEFLQEIHRFRTDHMLDEDLDVKSHSIEMISRNPADENSSDGEIKTEVIDEYQINRCNIQINEVEVECEPGYSQQISETSTNWISNLNLPKSNSQSLDLVHRTEDNLLIELPKLFERFQNRLISNNASIDHRLNNSRIQTDCSQSKVSIQKKSSKDDKPFKCSHCPFTSPFPSLLKIHITCVHSEERPFACDQCDYRAKLKRYLIVHKRTHMNESDYPFKCSECSYKTIALSNLKFHTACHHSDEKLFWCDHCDYRGKFRTDLIGHMVKHFSHLKKTFICNICSFKTTGRSNLRRHTIRKHSDAKPFHCDHCDFRGKMKCDLVLHMTKHFNYMVKTYNCSECSYKATALSSLKSHTLYKHSDEKPYHCNLCDFSSKVIGKLNTHKMTHLNDNDKPFKCSECSFKTETRTKLKMHTARKHSDEKPFACDQCNYRAKLKKNLSLHKRKHSSYNPFECSECSYKTTCKSLLDRHTMRNHNNEKPFSCDQCDYRAKIKENLYVHKKKHLKD